MKDSGYIITLAQRDHERDKLLLFNGIHTIPSFLSFKHSERHIICPTKLYVFTVTLHVSNYGLFNPKRVEFF